MIFSIPRLKYASSDQFFLIAGPCIIENDRNPFEIGAAISHIANRLRIPYIFKASYRKANRSRVDSFTGIGDIEGLEIIQAVGKRYDIPTLTDVHSPEEAEIAARYADILQIPAFLCRQTDLLIAVARTGKPVNIKKGQFLSPEAMKFPLEKVRHAGNHSVMITERGTTFGYQDLVVDFRGINIMRSFNIPVVLDVTHSLQQPNQAEGVTGGQPAMIETLARAGIAAGADGLFIETHPEPSLALSDGANMLKLDHLENLLQKLVKIRKAVI